MLLRKMVPKDKPLPKANTSVINAVHDLLQSDFTDLFVESKTKPDDYYKVLKTVTSDSEFASLPVYHNVPLTESVLNNVIGFGVITELTRRYPDISDIVYNGQDLWCETPNEKWKYGTKPNEDASILTKKYIGQLITKFTNNAENSESVTPTNPEFTGMYQDMRIAVADTSLTPPRASNSTFAIRVARAGLPLNVNNFSTFAPFFVYSKLLVPIIKGRASTLISGETGTAKTSLLKLMVGPMQEDDRIIMIEDTPETHLKKIYPKKDVLNWVTNPLSKTSIANLIDMSLRFDPRRVLVGEMRKGLDAYQAFQSVKTGHSFMTTLHAKDNATVPSRFAGMIHEAMPKADAKTLEGELLDYMDIGIHLSAKQLPVKLSNGKIIYHTFRFMDEMAEFLPKSKKYPDGVNPLFKQEVYLNIKDDKPWRKWQTFSPSYKIKDTVKRNYDSEFKVPYVQDGVHYQKIPLNNEV